MRPTMQQVNRPSLRLAFVYSLAHIHSDAWHDASFGSSPLALDRPVHVATKQTDDLRMPLHDGFKRRCLVGETVAADVMIADIERWVMYKQQRWTVGLLAKRRVEPCLPLFAQTPHALASQRRVDTDEANVVVIDCIMQKFTSRRHTGLVAKRGTQFDVVVTISRHEIKRCLKRRQQFTQTRILLGLTVLNRIAGENHSVGPLPIDIRNGAPKAISPQLGRGVIRFGHQYVRIADLGD